MLNQISSPSYTQKFSKGDRFLALITFAFCLISNLNTLLQTNYERFYFLNFLSVILLIPAWILIRNNEKIKLLLTLISFFNFVIFSISVQNIIASLFLYFLIQTSLILQQKGKNQLLFTFCSFVYWAIQYLYVDPSQLSILYKTQIWELEGGLIYLIAFLIYAHLALCLSFHFIYKNLSEKDETETNTSSKIDSETNSTPKERIDFDKLNEGVNQLYHILINSIDKAEIYDFITKEIANHIQAHRVALFLTDSFESDTFSLKSIYGDSLSTYPDQTFDKQGGILYEVATLKTPTLIKDIPNNYTALNSSLGQSKPDHIWLIPLVLKNETIGILELSFLGQPQYYTELYLKKVSKNLTTALTSLLSYQKNIRLLEETKKLKDEIEQKEQLILKHLSSLDTANTKVDFLKEEVKETLQLELNFFDELANPIIAFFENGKISRFNRKACDLLNTTNDNITTLENLFKLKFEEFQEVTHIDYKTSNSIKRLKIEVQKVNTIAPRSDFFLYLSDESTVNEYEENIQLLEGIIKDKDLQIERQRQTLLNQLDTTLYLKEKVDKLEHSD